MYDRTASQISDPYWLTESSSIGNWFQWIKHATTLKRICVQLLEIHGQIMLFYSCFLMYLKWSVVMKQYNVKNHHVSIHWHQTQIMAVAAQHALQVSIDSMAPTYITYLYIQHLHYISIVMPTFLKYIYIYMYVAQEAIITNVCMSLVLKLYLLGLHKETIYSRIWCHLICITSWKIWVFSRVWLRSKKGTDQSVAIKNGFLNLHAEAFNVYGYEHKRTHTAKSKN